MSARPTTHIKPISVSDILKDLDCTSVRKSDLIDIYYNLFDILDDVEMFTDALKHFTGCKLRRSIIKSHLEFLRLHNIEEELNMLYDVRVNDLKEYRIKYELAQKEQGYQSTLEDFM